MKIITILVNSKFARLQLHLIIPIVFFAHQTVSLSTAGADTGSMRLVRSSGEVSEVHENQSISVDDEKPGFLSLGTTVMVMLKPHTVVQAKAVRGSDWELTLQKGSVLSAIRNPKKRPLHFQIKTRAAVMGVRGTVFFVQAIDSSPIFLCACKGTVTVDSLAGKSFGEIKATHHDHPVILQPSKGDSLITLIPAPMGSDHNDAEVAEVEARLAAIPLQ